MARKIKLDAQEEELASEALPQGTTRIMNITGGTLRIADVPDEFAPDAPAVVSTPIAEKLIATGKFREVG